MKLLKKALALLLCLFCALSGCVLSASAETVEVDPAETKIYFEVPDDWNNWSYIYCHIYEINGYHLTNWQSKKERCTQVEGNLYSYDTTRAGGLTEGVTYGVIMSADTSIQTYDAVMTTECLGDTLYCDGTTFENPADFNKTAIAAYWRNQDPKTYGPILGITDLGNVVGSCAVEPVSDIFLDFITGYKLESARTYSGKTDQQIIDDVAYGLGLTNDEVAVLIEESGVTDIHWRKGLDITSFEVKPVTIKAGTNGYLTTSDGENDSYYHYSVGSLLDYTITFDDGTVKKGTGDFLSVNDNYYIIGIIDNQSYDNQWIAGNTYEVTASFMGKKTTFTVTIEESPVKKIEVSSLVQTYFIDTYLASDYDMETGEYVSYRKFSLDNVPFTITFKDGTVMTGTDIEYMGYTYHCAVTTDQSLNNQWNPGNTYTAYAKISDQIIPFSVKIVDNPYFDMEVVKDPDKTVFDPGEVLNPAGAVIRIHFSDGTYEDITLGNNNPSTGNLVYIERFGREFSWQVYEQEDDHYWFSIPELDVLKIKGSLNTSSIKAVTIKEENAELYATFTYSDNTQKTVKILGIQGSRGWEEEDTIGTGGHIYTDSGTYYGEFCTDRNSDNFYLTLQLEIYGKYDVNTVTSNTLETCLWWKLQKRFDNIAYAIGIFARDKKSFDGNITAENIDNLLSIACYAGRVYTDESTIVNEEERYAICKSANLRIAFYDLFGVMPDLKLSKNYNPADDTIKVYFVGSGGPGYYIPFTVESKDGTYTAQIHWGVSDYTITLNEELYLTAYNIIRSYGKLGDVNGDEDVNIKDATVIQKYIAKLTNLTDSGAVTGDVNNDKDINIKDATLIQKFIAGITVNFPVNEPVIR